MRFVPESNSLREEACAVKLYKQSWPSIRDWQKPHDTAKLKLRHGVGYLDQALVP
jgi:hypothetical protein